jgi:hypothetical protein
MGVGVIQVNGNSNSAAKASPALGNSSQQDFDHPLGNLINELKQVQKMVEPALETVEKPVLKSTLFLFSMFLRYLMPVCIASCNANSGLRDVSHTPSAGRVGKVLWYIEKHASCLDERSTGSLTTYKYTLKAFCGISEICDCNNEIDQDCYKFAFFERAN